MRRVAAILPLLLFFAQAAHAQAWRADISGLGLIEAWDLNESHEWLGGVIGGIDRTLWRGFALRTDGVVLRVAQNGADAWLRGFTIGTRFRWWQVAPRPFVDVAVGLANASRPTPPSRGSTFNYLAAIGAGIEVPIEGARVSIAGRWLHASNNGRYGKHLNPDIQALGVAIGVGWEY